MKTNPVAISRIPDEMFNRQHSPAAAQYLSRKYSKYGFKLENPVYYNPEFKPEYRKYDRYRFVENISDGLRKVGDSDDIIRLDHTGWFVDNYQEETVHGEVYQLPARNGESKYVPAVNDPWNKDCACLDFSSITNDKEEAARDADRMAEWWAEDARESQAKEDAAQRLDEIADEIKQVYSDYRKVIRELRANRSVMAVDVVRRMVREKWHTVKSEVRKLRKEAKRRF